MKKIVLAAFAAAVAVPAAAAPGDTATTQGSATAEIVAPLAITHDAGAVLDFGTIVPGTTAGTVSVDTAGNGSTVGDPQFVPTSTNSADAFTVTGEANRGFDILTGNEAMTGMTFSTTAALTGTLGAGGTAAVNVGGTLNVGANQAAGTYTGTYDVTVSYN